MTITGKELQEFHENTPPSITPLTASFGLAQIAAILMAGDGKCVDGEPPESIDYYFKKALEIVQGAQDFLDGLEP